MSGRKTLSLFATSADFQQLAGELKGLFAHKADSDKAFYEVKITGPTEDHPFMDVEMVQSQRPEPKGPFKT